MLAIKVPLKKAQKTKELLHSQGIYDNRYKPKKNSHIYFPILKKSRELNFEYSELELEEIEQQPDLPSSYDIIGDIAILEECEKQTAETLLKSHKNIKTVLCKAGIHSGEFRTQKLKYVAGERKKETIHKEHNTRLMLDVEKAYFSPRLSTERKRIYKQVRAGEEVLVMFSGIGVYPFVISKNTQAAHITGIEKNPAAHKYALENKTMNKTDNITLILGDVRDSVPDNKFDRIIMPLPKSAEDFLEYAFKAAKKGTIIHLYDFGPDEKQSEKKAMARCKEKNLNCKILDSVKCGQYSPGKYRLCVDFILC